MGWALVTRVLSGVALAIGLSLLVPMALSLLYADGSWKSFLLPAAAMVLIGAGGLRVTGSSGYRSRYVSNRDVYISVTLAWILSALLGGVPFLIEGTFDSPLDSTFEAMSGFTTTGATLLSDIEAQTPSILFWRSMTQWLGGVGIVVLFVAVAPVLGSGAARLLGAEVSGLTQTRLTPRIADTAKALIIIYLAISLAQTISLLLVLLPLCTSLMSPPCRRFPFPTPQSIGRCIQNPWKIASPPSTSRRLLARSRPLRSPETAPRRRRPRSGQPVLRGW